MVYCDSYEERLHGNAVSATSVRVVASLTDFVGELDVPARRLPHPAPRAR